MRITFVCSGNTCRSPLAEAAWQFALREMSFSCRARLARIEVRSAGLNARTGARASARAQQIAANWNADLSRHRAQIWSPSLAPDEMLIPMTREQAAQIRFRAGVAPSTQTPPIVTLGHFAAAAPDNALSDNALPDNALLAWGDAADEASHLDFDIPDPYGGSREAYEECGARILRGVRALAGSLCGQ